MKRNERKLALDGETQITNVEDECRYEGDFVRLTV